MNLTLGLFNFERKPSFDVSFDLFQFLITQVGNRRDIGYVEKIRCSIVLNDSGRSPIIGNVLVL